MGNTLPIMLAFTQEGSMASNGITVHNVVTVLPHYRLIQFCPLTCSVCSHVNTYSRDASVARFRSSHTHTHANTNTPASPEFYYTPQSSPISPACRGQTEACCAPPSSVNQLHPSILSAVGWVSHFTRDRSHLFCAAQLNADPKDSIT